MCVYVAKSQFLFEGCKSSKDVATSFFVSPIPSLPLFQACGNFFASCAARAAESSQRAEAEQERDMLRAFLAYSASLRSAGLERPIPSVKPLTDESATAAARADSNFPALGTPSLSIPSTPYIPTTPYTPSHPSLSHSKTLPHSSTVLPLLPSPAHGSESRGSGDRSETHEAHGGHEDDFLRWAFEWQVCPACFQLTTNPSGEGRGLIDDHGRAAPLACPSCGVAFPQRYTTSTVYIPPIPPPSCLFVFPCFD